MLDNNMNDHLLVACYDVSSELDIIREWYEMTRTPLDESTSMSQLEKEAQNKTDKTRNNHARVFPTSDRFFQVLGWTITNAECGAILMYTDGNSIRALFSETGTHTRSTLRYSHPPSAN